jgi:hypothetical protein
MALDVRIAVSGKLFYGRVQRVHEPSIADALFHDIAARNAFGGPSRFEASLTALNLEP